ncbi:MAG: carboxypeptidase regulatory-like domain-containing protein [Vicinamibacterales bacterium]
MRLLIASSLALLMIAVTAASAAEEPPSLRGQVVDTSRGALPGTTVTLMPHTPASAEPIFQVTDESGHFTFAGVPAGSYSVTFAMPGFDAKTISAVVLPTSGTLTIELRIGGFAEQVNVVADNARTDIRAAAGESDIQEAVLMSVPLARDRFEDALPLLPGVVRGPDGLLNMKGARAHESSTLVNGLNASDPVTGHAAVRLPLEAVETLNVHTGVYSAALGNSTGGVTDVVTRPGTDNFTVQVQNFFPRLRIKEGSVKGLDAFTPRVRVAGPIRAGKLWFANSFSYRFARSRVDELRPLEASEQIVENLDVLTQIDYAVSTSHRVRIISLVTPGTIDNANIDTLHPYDATPDMKQRGWNASVADQTVLGHRFTLASSVSIKEFDVEVMPKYAAPSRVNVNGIAGNYFNRIDRDSSRYDIGSTLSAGFNRWGTHLLSVGGQLTRASYDGIDESLPTVVSRADGTPLRRIDFIGSSTVGSSKNETAAFIDNQWSVNRGLTLHAGARYGHDSLSGDHAFAPRFDASVVPFTGRNTVVKVGIGRFHGKLPLNADGFTERQRRLITELDGSEFGARPVLIENRLDAGGLRTPVTTTWNVELDHEIARDLVARVSYRRSNGSRQLVIDSIDNESLVLSSHGASRSREIETTIRRRFVSRGEVNFSYVRSRAEGDLNDYVSLFGDVRDAIILPNEYGRQPFDVPNRFLLWGILHFPHQITASPTVEYRDGFPYTIVDDTQSVVGRRNGGARYPRLLTLDLAVTKDVRLTRKQRARVGVQIFNLTGHFNPRDVQNNTGSSTFGVYANNADRHVRAKFTLLF